LLLAPPDYQQGESVRIMFMIVLAAWMALSVHLFVALASAVALVRRHPLAEGDRTCHAARCRAEPQCHFDR
jgi:heme exporter protein C